MAKIGFIGLGIMGLPMARNLLKAGHSVVAYNRTRAKAEALAADGGKIADTPRQVAENTNIIITIVTDTPDVEAVIFGPEGVAAGAKAGTIIVDMSTISPIRTKDFAAELAQQQVELLDAPVSGG
ncbi:NAD(P)-binding domain-containing protein, partial [bacterium]|nr:NAD(P)-binding domain-containing protein [bacterium]